MKNRDYTGPWPHLVLITLTAFNPITTLLDQRATSFGKVTSGWPCGENSALIIITASGRR